MEMTEQSSIEYLLGGVSFVQFAEYVQQSKSRMVPENTSERALEFLAVSNAFGGEAGELQNICKKMIRGGSFEDITDLDSEFVLEAGDALHYLVSLIILAGYRPEFVMACNIEKLNERKRLNEEATIVLTETPAE